MTSPPLTPYQLQNTRYQLGITAGMLNKAKEPRGLSVAEMARACALKDGARHIRRLEAGTQIPSGPLCKLIRLMLKHGIEE